VESTPAQRILQLKVKISPRKGFKAVEWRDTGDFLLKMMGMGGESSLLSDMKSGNSYPAIRCRMPMMALCNRRSGVGVGVGVGTQEAQHCFHGPFGLAERCHPATDDLKRQVRQVQSVGESLQDTLAVVAERQPGSSAESCESMPTFQRQGHRKITNR